MPRKKDVYGIPIRIIDGHEWYEWWQGTLEQHKNRGGIRGKIEADHLAGMLRNGGHNVRISKGPKEGYYHVWVKKDKAVK